MNLKVFSINKTPENTASYPLHFHNHWEIMYYISGAGFLRTDTDPIPFEQGTIIIVPPKTVHGSVSGNGFVNVSIGGDFDNYFMFRETLAIYDNKELEGRQLVNLIFSNKYSDSKYVASLVAAYINFLLLNIEYENTIKRKINDIISNITDRYTDPALSTTAILQKSGYVEDYIRAEFKKSTGFTPVKFLTKARIDHAKRLFQLYGNSVTVSAVATGSGFSDPVYFSKKFKEFTGVSPKQYRKEFFLSNKADPR